MRGDCRGRGLLYLIFFFLLAASVFAHGDESELDGSSSQTVSAALIVSVIVVIAIICSLHTEHHNERSKWLLFLSIVIPIILVTVYIAGSTILLNLASESGGPVHWHADYEVWACGKELDLVDPEGLSNRIGSPVLHEHGDDRIHIEGVVRDFADVALEPYFESIGGDLHDDAFAYPTAEGLQTFRNGDSCPDGPGMVKVYVNGQRISSPESYVISSYSIVPPGDCIIIEFSPGESATTTRLCSSWEAKGAHYGGERSAIEEGEHDGG